MSKATLTKAVGDYLRNNGLAVSNSMANNVVDAAFSHIVQSLQTAGRFAYPGFGSFRVKVRAARSGTNALTGKPYSSPETKVVRFSQAKADDSFWTDLAQAKLYKGKAPKGKAPAAPKKAAAKK